MKVLVLDESQYERQALAKTLGEAGFSVDEAKDNKVAFSLLEREPPRVLVMPWPKTGGPDLLKRVRAVDSAHHIYVLVLLDKQPPSEITALYAAGVDDFVRRPFVREELLARVETPQRVEKWTTGKKVAFDWSSATDLRHLRACREMGVVVAEELGQMLGRSMQVTPGWSPEMTQDSLGATITLSLASVQTEIRVSIAVDATSLPAL